MVTQDFILNGSGKKSSNQFMVQKIILRHDEFSEMLIKFDLRVRAKVLI